MTNIPRTEAVRGSETLGGLLSPVEVFAEGGFAHASNVPNSGTTRKRIMFPTQVLDCTRAGPHGHSMAMSLKEARNRAGLSQEGLANKIDSGRSTIVKLEKGELPLNATWAARLAPALGCRPEDLYEGEPIPVVGYVGAGAAVHPIDDNAHGDGMDTVPRPPFVHGSAVAVEVRGDSLVPVAEDGWRLIYVGNQTIVEEEVLNRLCIVQLTDGRMLVKRIVRGSKPQRYHLLSTNAPMIEDAEIEWAARVKAIIPR